MYVAAQCRRSRSSGILSPPYQDSKKTATEKLRIRKRKSKKAFEKQTKKTQTPRMYKKGLQVNNPTFPTQKARPCDSSKNKKGKRKREKKRMFDLNLSWEPFLFFDTVLFQSGYKCRQDWQMRKMGEVCVGGGVQKPGDYGNNLRSDELVW